MHLCTSAGVCKRLRFSTMLTLTMMQCLDGVYPAGLLAFCTLLERQSQRLLLLSLLLLPLPLRKKRKKRKQAAIGEWMQGWMQEGGPWQGMRKRKSEASS